ncbi:unnamed protein product [Paramecium pentaurelia]|uniref:Transmembrane protein n=1 Tax=Paramecium pentaurelia TaxID=43138 RepID=A0A8S1X0L3_9CILI|nr:unnamed protein product [Paramecium pentaurelia]
MKFIGLINSLDAFTLLFGIIYTLVSMGLYYFNQNKSNQQGKQLYKLSELLIKIIKEICLNQDQCSTQPKQRAFQINKLIKWQKHINRKRFKYQLQHPEEFKKNINRIKMKLNYSKTLYKGKKIMNKNESYIKKQNELLVESKSMLPNTFLRLEEKNQKLIDLLAESGQINEQLKEEALQCIDQVQLFLNFINPVMI